MWVTGKYKQVQTTRETNKYTKTNTHTKKTKTIETILKKQTKQNR